jgi:hypothetical protein
MRNIASASTFTPNDDWFLDNLYLGIPAPVITTSLDTVAFDTTIVDSTSTLGLEISNTGFETLDVSQVISTSSEFSCDVNSFSLAAGANQLLNISFTPVQSGVRSGWLRLINNDPMRDTLNIYLMGIGEGVSGLDAKLSLPRVFAVHQNYPNPFNPVTTIHYELPRSSEVRLVIYNLLGQEVRTLLNSPIEAGRHQVVWNGTNDSGVTVASGIYIYRFEAGKYSKVMKMILVK